MTTTRPLSALLVVVLATGCQTSSPESSTSSSAAVNGPTSADLPVVWLPTDELNLERPDGTFVRAFVETLYRATWLDWEGAAPGFSGAYFPEMPLYERGHFRYYNYLDNRASEPRVRPHVAYMWAAPFTPLKTERYSRAADTGKVGVCLKPSIGLKIGDDPHFIAFTYRRVGRTPPANQRGTSPKPATNVFGGWHAADLLQTEESGACDNPPGGHPFGAR